jgi:large subunit ribosomal protein L30
VSDKAQTTIRIKWIRSGIGFSYHQKRIVQSLGLKKLNQEVDKPDTPQVRGLVAKVPHLVKIVEPTSKPAWMSVPEYTIYPPNATLTPSETGVGVPAIEAEKDGAPGDVTAAPAHPLDEGQGAGAQAVVQAPTEVPGAAVGIHETVTQTGEPDGPGEEEHPKTSEAASSEEEKPQV